MRNLTIILAKPRGFCAGAVRAIKFVEQALKTYGAPVYVLHEIVHNRHVTHDLQNRGTHFVEDLEEIPTGAITIFSAHGVSSAIVAQAGRRKLKYIDATCPLVKKVHAEAQRHSRRGLEVIVIGHHGHPEVEGTRGLIEGPAHVLETVGEIDALRVGDPEKLAFVTQTTLSVDDTREMITRLKSRFPSIRGPELDNICYATQDRQNAVRRLAGQVDVLLVVGSRNSSNSNRLRETGAHCGLPSYLIEDACEIDLSWLASADRVGLTAGASAPELLVQGVPESLERYFHLVVSEMEGFFGNWERGETVTPLEETYSM
jgi:4-hydroxy-3-methylbut-2-enyl diphosphate reductase